MESIILVSPDNKSRYLTKDGDKYLDDYIMKSDIKDNIESDYFCNIPINSEGNFCDTEENIFEEFDKIYDRDLLYLTPTSMLKRMLDKIDFSKTNKNRFFNSVYLKSIYLMSEDKYTLGNHYITPKFNHRNKTRRITVNFEGENLTALAKEDRELFLSHEDYNYITVDYTSHHLSIVSDILGIEIIDFHNYTSKLLNIDREKAKLINFKVIYGYEADKYLDKVPLYKGIVELRTKLYKEYLENKYFISPLSKEKFYFGDDINEGTLLSYFIQIYEAERMAKLIVDIKDQIPNIYISYIIYDSISFRYKKDTKIDLKLLDNILTENNKYRVNYE